MKTLALQKIRERHKRQLWRLRSKSTDKSNEQNMVGSI